MEFFKADVVVDMVVDEVWHGKNFGIAIIEFIFIGSYGGGGGGSYGGRGGSYGQLLSLTDNKIVIGFLWNLKEKFIDVQIEERKKCIFNYQFSFLGGSGRGGGGYGSGGGGGGGSSYDRSGQRW